jgi:Ran GTPase-activating protein (RanGAP) involved in mRNA processing and transport
MGYEAVLLLRNLTSLGKAQYRKLVFDSTRFDTRAMTILVDCIRGNPNLKELSLDDNLIDDQGIEFLFGNLTETNIKDLRIPRNPFVSSGVNAISKYLESNGKLSALNLNCKICRLIHN